MGMETSNPLVMSLMLYGEPGISTTNRHLLTYRATLFQFSGRALTTIVDTQAPNDQSSSGTPRFSTCSPQMHRKGHPLQVFESGQLISTCHKYAPICRSTNGSPMIVGAQWHWPYDNDGATRTKSLGSMCASPRLVMARHPARGPSPTCPADSSSTIGGLAGRQVNGFGVNREVEEVKSALYKRCMAGPHPRLTFDLFFFFFSNQFKTRTNQLCREAGPDLDTPLDRAARLPTYQPPTTGSLPLERCASRCARDACAWGAGATCRNGWRRRDACASGCGGW